MTKLRLHIASIVLVVAFLADATNLNDLFAGNDLQHEEYVGEISNSGVFDNSIPVETAHHATLLTPKPQSHHRLRQMVDEDSPSLEASNSITENLIVSFEESPSAPLRSFTPESNSLFFLRRLLI